ncbi:MAG: PorT family protein [Bacteroidaceae bacterium]|jgi:opacity protein-like surface antigen|nr:PorT family protein [Bacteroidaceae bacterium]
MKKIFLMMAFVAMTLGAAAQENSFNVKGGVGLSYLDVGEVTYKLNWKVGAGYEFRLNDLIGIEPSLLINSKGCKTDYDMGQFSSQVKVDNKTINLLYVEVPVMCNFHINDNWELGAGIYGAYLVDDDLKDLNSVSVSVAGSSVSVNLDDDSKPNKVDFGAYAVAKYNFDNGLFVGLDYSYGFNEVAKYSGKNNTFGALVGFRF